MSVAEEDDQERAMTLRDMQKAETRGRVLEAARALFSEKGYEAATIREIARRAGVAPGSVFTTFASKTELLQEIIFTRYQESLPEVLAAAQSQPSAFARLEAVFQASYANELKELRLLAETIGASYRWTASEEHENRRRLSPLYEVLLNIAVGGVASGEIKSDIDPALLADVIFSCYLRNFRRALYDGWDAVALAGYASDQLRLIFEGARAA